MTTPIHYHNLRASDKEAMQAQLATLGIQWDGQATHLLTEANGQQVELAFLDTWPNEVNEETNEVISYYPGYHANAVSRGAEPFNFGSLAIEVANPKVRWAGVGGEHVG